MNPLIPDAELRDLFQAECEEHLQELDRGLLHLEKSPGDRSVLEDVFRRVHSLKGSARMLGVGAVETVAHRFEDVLGAARSNRTRLTAEIADRLYQGLDAIRQLVHEAVTGAPSGVRVPEVLARLSVTAQGPGTAPPATPPREHRVAPADVPDPAAAPSPASSLPPVPATPSARHDSPPAARSDSLASDSGQPIAEAKTMPAAGPPDTAPSAAFSIDTVRVKPQQLDTLMTLAGELAVTKIQLARRARDLEELVNYWEEWNREAAGKGARPAGSPAGGVSPDRYALDDGLAAVRTRERLERLGVLLGDLLRRVHDDDNRLESVADRIDGSVRTMRLLPLKRIFHLFPRMMRDLARQYDKEVEFVIEGEDVPADKRLLEELKDPLMHLLRNSLDHGLESPADREHRGKPRQGTVRLRAWQTATNVCIEVRDDGRGLDLEAIKRTALQKKLCGPEIEQWSPGQIQHLIFAPGFSTAQYITDVSGRGVGLDVVRANVERLKGVISIESAPGRGCAFRLELPISLSTIRVLIVQVQRLKVAVPVEFVDCCRLVRPAEIFALDGRDTVSLEGEPISVAPLATLLELGAGSLPPEPTGNQPLICVFLLLGKERLGLLVDGLVTEQEVLLKPFKGLLRRVRNISGSTILGSGEVCMILNVPDLHRSVRKLNLPAQQRSSGAPDAPAKRTILLAEDSITTRIQLKRILEGAGYEVVAAVDGRDALGKLEARPVSAVISDVQMPHLDGLGLTERIRQSKSHKDLPVILVTSLASEDDRKRGLEVGASAYITKPAFDQKVLLETLQRLI